MKSARETPRRFAGLDGLRGVAALGVVFWHWSHFGVLRAPFTDAFGLFHRHGWLAVDLFFSLSGFIFFWMYSQRVAARELSAASFAWLRFSRLYPLHLATLLLVAAGQWWLMGSGREPFVYPDNDGWHFTLNLAFASSWGLEKGYSFNGPAWSISVEVLLYALFFVFCRLLPVRMWTVAAMSLGGFALAATGYAPLGRGVGSFFLGGAICFAYLWVDGDIRRRVFTGIAAALAITAWGVTAAWASPEPTGVLRHLPKAWAVFVLFPLTILTLALAEPYLARFTRSTAWLGDTSYSVYLLHFPLQLACYLCVDRATGENSIYASGIFLTAFFAVLLALATASHRFFEIPVQNWLRSRWVLQPRVMERKPGESSLAGLER